MLEPAGPGGKSELPEENQRLLGTLELKATNNLDDSVVFLHKLMKRHLMHLGKVLRPQTARELEHRLLLGS